MSTSRGEAARLVDALAWVAEGAPERMRAAHLAPRAHALAAELKRGALPAGAGRVYLAVDAGVKAAILTELRRRGLAGEDALAVYAWLVVVDSVLERLGLAVVPALPAAVARVGGEAEEEAELERYSHLAEP
jgi:hypothetical protein